MANLLEEASILLTPTAYDNGKMLAVKPSDNLYGLEEITNGDFANGSTDWTLGTGWSIGDSKVDAINAAFGSSFTQNMTVVPNRKYKVSFDVSDYVKGNFRIQIGNKSSSEISSNGSFTFFLTSINSSIVKIETRSGGSGTTLSIDNISVKEDLSGDFSFSRNSAATRVNAQGLVENVQILSSNLVSNGDFSEEGSEEVLNGGFSNGTTNWNAVRGNIQSVNDECVFTLGGTELNSLVQSNVFTVGKSYLLEFYAKSDTYNTNIFTAYLGVDNIVQEQTVSSEFQKWSYYISPNQTNLQLGIFYSALYENIIFDNISVKEVGQDWTLGTGWSIGSNELIATSMSNQFVTQSFTFTSGKRYRASFSVIGTSSLPSSNSLRLPYDGAIPNIAYVAQNSDGVYSHEFVSNGSSTLYLGYGSFTGSITNISVIEITDDTNLPRINYEGFSYQDSLGSEEIVNGTFDSDTTWIKNGQVTIGGGVAYFDSDGTFTQIAQSISGVSGKNVKVVIEITEYTQGTLKVLFSGGTQQNLPNSIGVHTLYFNNADSDTINIARLGGVTNLKIDNVSVKEYLGQEVVPDSGCGSWLMEGQSTNLITYSSDFSDASWTKLNGATVTADTIISPDGTLNADSFTFTTSTADKLQKIVTVVPSVEYTVSCYIKSDSNITIKMGGATAASPINVTTEWVRHTITHTNSATTTAFPQITSNGTAGTVYIYGFQLEQHLLQLHISQHKEQFPQGYEI